MAQLRTLVIGLACAAGCRGEPSTPPPAPGSGAVPTRAREAAPRRADHDRAVDEGSHDGASDEGADPRAVHEPPEVHAAEAALARFARTSFEPATELDPRSAFVHLDYTVAPPVERTLCGSAALAPIYRELAALKPRLGKAIVSENVHCEPAAGLVHCYVGPDAPGDATILLAFEGAGPDAELRAFVKQRFATADERRLREATARRDGALARRRAAPCP